MKKNFILTTLLFFTGYTLAMEEREKPINPQVKAQLDKLPGDIQKPVKEILTIEDIPNELLMVVFSQLAGGKQIENAIGAINQLRLVSKRFNNLINDISFLDPLLKYLSQKYNMPRTKIARLWGPIPGIKAWLDRAEKQLNPIEQAIRQGDKEKVMALLNSFDVDYINETNIGGETLLHLIINAQRGWHDILKLLLEKGADINRQAALGHGDFGDTPLISAIRLSDDEVVKLLLENGADPNKKNLDKGGKSPLEVIDRRIAPYSGFAGHPIIVSGQKIKDLLVKHGAK